MRRAAGPDGTPQGYVDLPGEWSRESAGGPGPFVTTEVFHRPDGRLVWWRSRAHRRVHARAGRWMAAGFALGAVCFAVASIASQWATAPRPAIGVTFFVGSIFFTAAAYLQYWQAVNVDHGPMTGSTRRRLRPVSWEPHRIDWLASLVQFVGTISFNVSTFEGMQRGLTSHQANLRVWVPDVFGSICFLVASELAFAEVCGRWFCIRGRSLSWRIVALNLLGSAAFGVAAVTAVIEPSTDEPLSAAIANATTTLGALCFLAGALMLVPEERKARLAAVSDTAPADAHRTPA
jgi:multisubunit Na+/H+ antiporter MnhF subunit